MQKKKTKNKGIDSLLRYTHDFFSFSFSASCQAMAATLVDKAGGDADRVKSKKWWQGFKRRHATATIKTPKGLEQNRARQGDPGIICDMFDKLDAMVKTHKITAHTMWNVDEKPFILDPVPRRVVTTTSSKPQQQHRRTNDHITVNICASAAGNVLPPQVIFSRKQLRSDLLSNGPEDALYCTSPKGSMSVALFQDWFEKIFLPATSRERTQVSKV